MLSHQSGFKKNELLIIGDSLESDVALADAFGSPWVLYAPHGYENAQGNAISKMNDLLGMILR